MTSDTTRWPLPDERAPFATVSHGGRGRRQPRSAWLLTGLAFLCGGLVSAAAFSIGWRHQAQRDTAAQSALAAVRARTHRLEHRIGTLQASLDRSHASAAAAAAAEKALARAGAKVGDEATAASGDAVPIASGAGSLGTAATRIASELRTLDTYLTSTPTDQLDPGYIGSQTAYLGRQLTRLQSDAGTLGSSIASFEAALRKLSRDAKALQRN
jgi:prefoldin subunit 5